MIQNEAVRDLAWLLDSKWDLLDEISEDHNTYRKYAAPNSHTIQDWLLQLDAAPTKLEQAIAAEGHKRLGLYFETLIAFYFDHCPKLLWSLTARNRQIIEGPRTIGELDFLLDTPEGSKHLEAAVKFYLGYQQEGPVRWIGPNGKDRLDLKLKHMATHQLPLGKPYAAESIYWLKGMLFQPWQTQLTLPQGIQKNVAKYSWIYVSDFVHSNLQVEKNWRILPKLRWLTGFPSMPEKEAPLDLDAILEEINLSGRPQMFSETETEERLMIVHDSWPKISPTK